MGKIGTEPKDKASAPEKFFLWTIVIALSLLVWMGVIKLAMMWFG